MKQDYTITSLGDSVLLIRFANVIDDAIHAKVLHLFHQIRHAAPFIRDVVPAYSSLAVYYDVASLQTSVKPAFERIKEFLLPLVEDASNSHPKSERELAIPVCYAPKYAPDLEDLAVQKSLTTEEVIHLHTAKSYRVYMIGFLPGFPYMGKVDSRIATPRKNVPRTTIAAGSVGIAGEQTGIYPFASPGGWNIIGQTPLQLFNKDDSEPALLQPGDTVRFYSISEDEFEHYQSRLA